jgi:DNA-binding NtrC family response regulator
MADGSREEIVSNPASAPSVLLVDDDPALIRALRRLIEPEGFSCRDAHDVQSVATALESEPQLALVDLRFGEVSGVDLIREMRSQSPDTEIIVMTGYASIDSAVASMRAGAFDYLEKPFQDARRVVQTLERALERRTLRTRNRELEGELERRSAIAGIVAQSAAMKRVVRTILDLSENQSNVLIEAASGTGKELVARAVHETSLRREGPFMPVDCGALPESIAEAELFGHERGAFTGAIRAAPGLFRSANGGTLFLDEVGELSPRLQSKLLRAIQEREVRPLGASAAVPIDVRIISATNRDLEGEVKKGCFRSDLFYRLRVVSIQLATLRERPEDIPVLAAHFLERHGEGRGILGLEPEALEALLTHPWEGNVRELENSIEAAVALARGPRLTVTDLGLSSVRGGTREALRPEGIPLTLPGYERACLEEALVQAEGDIRRAASLLGIGRSTLYRKLKTHGIHF